MRTAEKRQVDRVGELMRRDRARRARARAAALSGDVLERRERRVPGGPRPRPGGWSIDPPARR